MLVGAAVTVLTSVPPLTFAVVLVPEPEIVTVPVPDAAVGYEPSLFDTYSLMPLATVDASFLLVVLRELRCRAAPVYFLAGISRGFYGFGCL